MKKLFMSIFALTVFDAAATAAGVRKGYLAEANPLLEKGMDVQPLLTVLVICIFTGFLLLVLYRLHHRIWWIPYAMFGIFAIKVAVVCFHVVYAFQAFHSGYFA